MYKLHKTLVSYLTHKFHSSFVRFLFLPRFEFVQGAGVKQRMKLRCKHHSNISQFWIFDEKQNFHPKLSSSRATVGGINIFSWVMKNSISHPSPCLDVFVSLYLPTLSRRRVKYSHFLLFIICRDEHIVICWRIAFVVSGLNFSRSSKQSYGTWEDAVYALCQAYCVGAS